MQKVKQALKEVAQAHYLTNILLASSYFVLKNVPHVCDAVFESCLLEWREVEILMLLVIALAIKTRKAATWLQFVSTMCTFSKACYTNTKFSFFLFFNNNKKDLVINCRFLVLFLVNSRV